MSGIDFSRFVKPITVNGAVISAAAIAAEAQNHPAPKGKPGWAMQAAARALTLRELLLQEARARGLAGEAQDLDADRRETGDEALIRELLDEALPEAEIDEDRLRALYDAQPERFFSPSLFEAAHILIPAPKGDILARTRALEQAEAILAELARAPRRFAELAAEYSACQSRENGGMLGQLASGDTVPEFEAALTTMEEGTISPAPVATRYGLHIIRLDARVRGQLLPWETVRPYLVEAEEKAHWVRASKSFVATLVAKARIAGIDMSAEQDAAPEARASA